RDADADLTPAAAHFALRTGQPAPHRARRSSPTRELLHREGRLFAPAVLPSATSELLLVRTVPPSATSTRLLVPTVPPSTGTAAISDAPRLARAIRCLRPTGLPRRAPGLRRRGARRGATSKRRLVPTVLASATSKRLFAPTVPPLRDERA